MAGIGHLLAEGEIEKEGHDPIMQAIRRAAVIGAAAAGGIAAAGTGTAAYISHRHGKRQAERDFHAGNTPEWNKPGAGTFLASMPAGVTIPGVGLIVSGTAGLVAGRRGYDKRLAELRQEKQGALNPMALLTPRLIAAGAVLSGGAAGYASHRYGQDMAERDFHAGTPGKYKPSTGTFLASAAIGGGVGSPVSGPAGLLLGRRAYDKRMAELQQQ